MRGMQNKYHFVGVGGIGMSALAQVLAARGCQVRGSEQSPSKTAKLLQQSGVTVFQGHHASHVGDAQCVVWSSAISPDNPEILQAQAAGIPLLHRAELLAELANAQKSIAVAGMHGKTTTTNMMFHVLRASGLDPTLISGGIDAVLGSNAHAGKDPVMVLEADESDGSLVHFAPHSAILTNCEEEHMGFYKNLDQILSVFGTFVDRVHEDGAVAYGSDDKNLRRLVRGHRAPFVAFGLRRGARVRARHAAAEGSGMCFEACEGRRVLGGVRLAVAGLHNVSNALAVIAVALRWGIAWDAIRRGLENFRGTARRLETKGVVGDVRVLDDYAHHPTEVKASLKALAAQKTSDGCRIVVVFQPHRYSRVRHLTNEFATAFVDADTLILTPIYSAGEADLGDVSQETLAEGIRRAGHKDVRVQTGLEKIAEDLSRELRPGDMVVGMGAGDIEKFGPIMKDVLSSRKRDTMMIPERVAGAGAHSDPAAAASSGEGSRWAAPDRTRSGVLSTVALRDHHGD